MVFLMALFSTVAILRLGVGQGTLIEAEARQFAERLNVLMDESLMSGKTFRIVFDPENQSYVYQAFDSQWQEMTDKPFTKQQLKNTLALDFQSKAPLETNAEQTSSDTDTSDSGEMVVIGSDGVSSEFELRFGERNKSNQLNSDARTWLVRGGQSVDVTDEDDG